MAEKRTVDLVSGLALAGLGVYAAAHSAGNYSAGTGTRLGSASFPFAVGVALIVFGGVIAAKAWLMGRGRISLHLWPMFAVVGAIALFAFLLPRLGLIPAAIGLTLVARFPDQKQEPIKVAIFGLAAGVTAYLIFRVGLGVPMAPFAWRF